MKPHPPVPMTGGWGKDSKGYAFLEGERRRYRTRAFSQARSLELQVEVLMVGVKTRTSLVRIERMVGGNTCMRITGFKFLN